MKRCGMGWRFGKMWVLSRVSTCHVFVLLLGLKGIKMNRNKHQNTKLNNRDTLQPEYDFSKAVRGVTAKRYAEGTNVVVILSDILDVFPNTATVSEALRALAPVIRHQRQLNAKAA